MDRERIYKLADGTERKLVSYMKINNVRYLLLYDEKNDELDIAYEEDNKLKFLKKENELYEELLKQLYSKIENEID